MGFKIFRKPGNYIAGRFKLPAKSDGLIEVRSPADTDDVVGLFPFAVSSVDRAVAAARRAFKSWRKTEERHRAALLQRYQKALEENIQVLSQTISREVGKPLWEARAEVGAMIEKVDLTVDAAQSYTATRSFETLPAEIRYRPHGVVAVVGPFNFPAHLPNGQIIPALLLGNTVVFKPSERTPGTATVLASCIAQAGFAPGVFNLVQGDAPVAEALVDHEDIDAILFTGSAAVGQSILRKNAHRPGRLIALELGGKNAAIVLDDCNLELAAREIAFAGFATSGQRCTAISRVMVTKKNAAAFARRLAEIAQKIVVGHFMDEDVFMGPVISEDARDKILDAQAQALERGFEPLASGRVVIVPGHPGWYLRPSLHLAPSSRILVPEYQEQELFGPDIVIYEVSDREEAIAVANQSPYGLSAAVFTSSPSTFQTVANELDVGVVHWNRSTAGASGHLSFGGIKHSGNHRPGGALMVTSCAYPQAVLFERPKNAPPPNWPGFPSV